MADNHERTEAELNDFYDYTKDARFESMWDYPRRTHLYRKHKDLRADCERKLKYYQRNQSLFCTETQRQQLKIWERFSRMHKHTIDENSTGCDALKFSHNLTFRNVPKSKESLVSSLTNLRRANEDITHRRFSQMNMQDYSRTSILRRGGRRRGPVNIALGGLQREKTIIFTDDGDHGQKQFVEEEHNDSNVTPSPQPPSTIQLSQPSQRHEDIVPRFLVRSSSSVGVPNEERNTTDLLLRRSATTLQKEVLRFLTEGPDNYKSPFHHRKARL